MITKNYRKVRNYIREYRHKLNNRKLVLSIIAGFMFGLFPILGSTTILCLVIAFTFRLDIVLVQLVSWTLSPAQVIFIIPFAKTGEAFNSFFNIHLVAQSTQFFSLQNLLYYNLSSIVGWFIIVSPFSFVLYFVVFKLFEHHRLKTELAKKSSCAT